MSSKIPKTTKVSTASPKEVERAKYLANYRTVNPAFQTDRPELQAVVDTILTVMKSEGLIKRTSDDLRYSLTAFILNLYVNEQDDTLVGINLGKEWFEKNKWTKEKESKGKYCLPRYWKYSTVTGLDKNLRKLGLLERVRTGYKSMKVGKESQITKIHGTDKLWVLFDSAGVEPFMFFTDLNRRDDRKLVILKDKNKEQIKIPERLEKQAEPIRQNLKKINDAISQHVITLNISDDELKQLNERRARKRSKWGAIKKKDRSESNPNADFIWKTSLYRVFHQDFEHHGRFYGGFWETIPNKKRWKDTDHKLHTDGIEFRRRILIDGEETVEIDFSSMHTRLIYHLEGIAYNEDPYLAVVKKYLEPDGIHG